MGNEVSHLNATEFYNKARLRVVSAKISLAQYRELSDTRRIYYHDKVTLILMQVVRYRDDHLSNLFLHRQMHAKFTDLIHEFTSSNFHFEPRV